MSSYWLEVNVAKPGDPPVWRPVISDVGDDTPWVWHSEDEARAKLAEVKSLDARIVSYSISAGYLEIER